MGVTDYRGAGRRRGDKAAAHGFGYGGCGSRRKRWQIQERVRPNMQKDMPSFIAGINGRSGKFDFILMRASSFCSDKRLTGAKLQVGGFERQIHDPRKHVFQLDALIPLVINPVPLPLGAKADTAKKLRLPRQRPTIRPKNGGAC